MRKLAAIILADHEIGYHLTKFLLAQENVEVKGVFTNPEKGWWTDLTTISETSVSYFEGSEEFYERIKEQDFDLLFLLSWRHVMPDKVVKLPKLGTVNLHYSLLPRHRGVYPVNWSIISGDNETGVTYHWVNNKVDQGDIITQARVPIKSHDTSLTLLKKLDVLAFQTFVEMWEQGVENWYHQPQSAYKGASYHSLEDYRRTNKINPEATYTVREIINLLRGKTFNPDMKSLYFVDEDGRKVYLNLILSTDEANDKSLIDNQFENAEFIFRLGSDGKS